MYGNDVAVLDLKRSPRHEDRTSLNHEGGAERMPRGRWNFGGTDTLGDFPFERGAGEQQHGEGGDLTDADRGRRQPRPPSRHDRWTVPAKYARSRPARPPAALPDPGPRCARTLEATDLWNLHAANEAEFPARDGLVEAARVLCEWVPGCGIGVRARASADGSELTLAASATKGVWVTQLL